MHRLARLESYPFDFAVIRQDLGGLPGKVYVSDGRPLPNPMPVSEIRAISGERYDIIFEPTRAGEYIISTDIFDWITGEVLGTAKTNVVVS